MKSLVAVTGLVLVSMSMGVARADSPGGWSQFNDMMKPRQVAATSPVRQQTKVVDVYANSQQQGTWLFPPNANEGSNN